MPLRCRWLRPQQRRRERGRECQRGSNWQRARGVGVRVKNAILASSYRRRLWF